MDNQMSTVPHPVPSLGSILTHGILTGNIANTNLSFSHEIAVQDQNSKDETSKTSYQSNEPDHLHPQSHRTFFAGAVDNRVELSTLRVTDGILTEDVVDSNAISSHEIIHQGHNDCDKIRVYDTDDKRKQADQLDPKTHRSYRDVDAAQSIYAEDDAEAYYRSELLFIHRKPVAYHNDPNPVCSEDSGHTESYTAKVPSTYARKACIREPVDPLLTMKLTEDYKSYFSVTPSVSE
ncbi:hypothetical protein QBC35DRAFT_471243 [Podospora australis]|uniref:Uncharacterized protein n=1 Tax=Podospora australis TaxID=1536484 RepID=A0AAN6X0Y2_9PEZI|nr:hypothetical protein QBC35DRAFT_471243 [Podospora australis]